MNEKQAGVSIALSKETVFLIWGFFKCHGDTGQNTLTEFE